MHRVHSGKWIDFKNPQTFTEKLQWLKVNRKNSQYQSLVDKITVKDYVAQKVGANFVIPTYAVYDAVDDIRPDQLPERFVLKTNHAGGGGGIIICRDKATLDWDEVKRILDKTMKKNWYQYGCEYPYKNLRPKILCEQLLEIQGVKDLPDYKFYCFNGVPQYCQLIQSRSTSETIDFYDMQWQKQEFWGLNVRTRMSDTLAPCPKNFELMKRIASTLAADIHFVRVDLYNIDGQIYFGELTFFPASGFGKFTPDKYNTLLGDLIKF